MDRNTNFTLPCELCKAAIDQGCKTKVGNPTSTHKVRLMAVAASLIPLGPAEYSFDERGTDPIRIWLPGPLPYQDMVASTPYIHQWPVDDAEYIGPVPELVNPIPAAPVIMQLSEPVLEAELVASFKSKQKWHVLQSKADGVLSRVPRPVGLDADIDLYFAKRELRDFLELCAPCDFAVVSCEDLEKALDVLSDGLKSLGGTCTFDGKVLTGWVRDGQGATFIVTPAGLNVTLRDFNIKPMLKNASDVGKFMKYLKRLCAMYVHSQSGEGQNLGKDAYGTYVSYFTPTGQYKVRYGSALTDQYVLADGTSLGHWTPEQEKHLRSVYGSKMPKLVKKEFKIEGCGYVTPRFANEHFGLNPDTGKPWRVGQLARITFICNGFLWKGHVMIWKMKNVDATFWDEKTIIGTEQDTVFVGFMGCLHAGRQMKLNIQPIINFGLQHLLIEFGQLAADNYGAAVADPVRAERMFQSLFDEDMQAAESEANDDGDITAKIKKWRAMYAYYKGFEVNHEPFLIRDAYSAFEKSVCNLLEGKVPVPESVGFRAYYFIDPYCITDEGTFNPAMKKLSGNHVYNKRLAQGTEIVTWRDPQTRHEYVICEAVAPPARLDKQGREVLFDLIDENALIVSIDFAMDFAEDQGGGDYDDCGNIYLRADIVDHFKHHLPKYPDRVKAVKAAKIKSWFSRNVSIQNLGLDKVEFNTDALTSKVKAAMNSDAGVGMIVNWLLVSCSFSFYKTEKLAYANQKMASLPTTTLAECRAHDKWRQAVDWLNAFEVGSENFVSSSLEDAIDGLVMNGAKGDTDYNSLGNKIREFWKNCPVVPYWATIGGRLGAGRIPKKCKQQKPVVVMDPVSDAFKELEKIKRQLDDTVTAQQWLGVLRAPEAIRKYPVTDEVIADVTLRNEQWDAAMRARMGTKRSEESYKGFIALCDAEKEFMESHTHAYRMMHMAEALRRIHNGPFLLGDIPTWSDPDELDEDGNPTEHPLSKKDSRPNSPRLFKYRVQLWEELGLSKTRLANGTFTQDVAAPVVAPVQAVMAAAETEDIIPAEAYETYDDIYGAEVNNFIAELDSLLV